MRTILLSLLAALLLAGCSARAVGYSEVRGLCNTANIGDSDDDGMSCKEQLDICSRFLDPLAEGVKDRAECLAQCRSTYDSLFHTYAVDPCREAVSMSRDYCEQYCRGNFQ